MALKILRALHLLPNDHNLTWLSFKSISQISYPTTYRHTYIPIMYIIEQKITSKALLDLLEDCTCKN